MNLDNALCVVTGAGSGIGRATAAALAARGARLVISDIDQARLDDVARELGAAVVLARVVDVGDRAQVAALAEACHAIQPGVDVLVNNAGVGQAGGVLDTSLDDWDFTLRVNLMGTVYGCHYFVPAMVARGRGHVVNVSSMLGFMPSPWVIAYQASKFAVLGLTLSMRSELAGSGVRATAICPGMINTAIVDDTRFSARNQGLRGPVAQSFSDRGWPPSRVADAIVGVLGTDTAVRPVGPEAWFAWGLTRLAPRLISDRLTRLMTRRLEKHRTPAPPAG
ncbi:MAG: SDR family NAD(P)-dependent oxidoreductase [Myxococcales bacterium]|nr:SDR family NAD(P)-dependent oxidoreductase [Myxococcales bacterium]